MTGGLFRSVSVVSRATAGRGHRGASARVALVALALLTLSGCISDEREREIGDQMAAEVNPHLPIIQDPQLNAYVQTIGRRIGEVSGRADLEYTFYIVNTDIVNAFALPGGHIYLTRGLIERTKDGSEFAGVLAHEIGHVAARHGVQKLQRHLRTGSVVSVLYNTILGGEPELLRDNSLQLADVIWSAEHSRRDEREADRLAIRYLNEAGLDPRGVVTLLEKLLADEQRTSDEFGRLETWFSSHPLTETRIADAREAIRRLPSADDRSGSDELEQFDTFRRLVMRFAPDSAAMVHPLEVTDPVSP